MFKLKTFVGNLNLVCVLAATISADSVYARIGEIAQDFERHLLSKRDGAYVYSAKEDRLREAMELPYKYMFLIMPRGVEHGFYFKRSDSVRTTDSDTVMQNDLYGWELHAAFFNDKSAVEFYQRYGDVMTVEELKALMKLEAKSRGENVRWLKENFVPIKNRWDLKFEKGNVVQTTIDAEGREISPDGTDKLSDILPVSTTRFIYVEVPDAVKSASTYMQSIPFLIMEDEQRKANEAYRAYVANTSAASAAKTARKKTSSTSNTKPAAVQTAKSAKIFAFNASTSSIFSQEFIDIEKSAKGATKLSLLRYWLNDVIVGGTPFVRYDKIVRLTMEIPQQPDTAFGFDYRLSDGSIRAKLYRNGILFISAEFDKMMRAYMERLFEAQEETRRSEALESVSKF